MFCAAPVGAARRWPQDCEEVVAAAVAGHGDMLRFASLRLRAKRRVALAAVASWGKALQHASEALRGDREVTAKAERGKGTGGRGAPRSRESN